MAINTDVTGGSEEDRPSIGDIVTAVVVDVPPFGLFVEIDGVHRGFIDVLDISADGSRVDMSNLPQPGTMVEAVVIGIEEDGAYRLSLRSSFKNLKERWLQYKREMNLGTVVMGPIRQCRNGKVLIDIGAPFIAELTNPSFDADDWNNVGLQIQCRIAGFDDRLLRVLVEEE